MTKIFFFFFFANFEILFSISYFVKFKNKQVSLKKCIKNNFKLEKEKTFIKF